MKKLVFLFLLSAFQLNAFSQQVSPEDALAFQYYQQGEFGKAADMFEKLFTRDGSDRYFDFYYNALLKVKNYADAEKATKKMIRTYPGNSLYTIALGRIYQENGKKAEADKLFDTAIKNLPKDEFRIREIANAFYKVESYDHAIAVFMEGRKRFDNPQLFAFDLLSIYRFKKDKEMLVKEYIELLFYMPEALFQAENTLASVFESNADYKVLQGILLKKIQKNPDVAVYSEMLIWQFLQQQEYDMALRQLIAQDKRTRSDGTQLFNAASTFIANKAYPIAIKVYEYLMTKGKESPFYLSARLELINTKYLLATSGVSNITEIEELADQYDAILQEYGKTRQTIFALKKWAGLQAYYLYNLPKAESALEEALKINGLPASEIGQIKLELGDIYVLTDQPWEAVLTYEQVAKQFENTAIGHEANFRSARLSFYQGNFNYAKSQVDVLKASTSQLIANDALNLSLLISDNLQNPSDSLALKMYADAEMLQFRNLVPAAMAKLDSIAIIYPNNSLEDDVLMAKAKIFIQRAEFSKAALALDELATNFRESLWADDAIFSLADLYETKLMEPEKAKDLYQQLITDHPGSMFAAEARKRFRSLRGDVL